MPQATATPKATQVAVSTRRVDADQIETSITDRGPGLVPAAQGRAFEPFFTTKPQGLGLGLAICSTIVGVHGGQLALVNNADGGARATFTLPARRFAAAVP